MQIERARPRRGSVVSFDGSAGEVLVGKLTSRLIVSDRTKRFFLADRAAVTALEYGIIASILGLVLVTIFSNFGSTLKNLFSHVASSI
jgi:Flp pilus assembly pilin Flp